MSLKIHSDFSAMATGTLSQLHKHQAAMGKAIERVSTGYKINSAADGSIQHYLATKLDMKAEEQTATNEAMQTGAGWLNTADKALNSILDTLRQMRDIANSVANNTAGGGSALTQAQDDYNNLLSDVKSMANNAKFNDNAVIKTDEQESTTLVFDATNGWSVKFTLKSLSNVDSLDGGNDLADISSAAAAIASGGTLGKAILEVEDRIAVVGNALARVNSGSNYLEGLADVNIESRDTIKNADMAKEMTEYVKQNVLAQASQAMLSQANSGLASVLNLLS